LNTSLIFKMVALLEVVACSLLDINWRF
jgi:hypothetical protein